MKYRYKYILMPFSLLLYCLNTCAQDTSPTSKKESAQSEQKTKQESPQTLELFQKDQQANWKMSDVGGSGDIEFDAESTLTVNFGESLSGAVYQKPETLPVTNYRITLEARRIDGSDFFCGLTFPYGNLETCATFIVGGWGGGLVGISSIDGNDASQNNTGSFHRFENNTWIKITLEVREGSLKAWLDDKIVVNENVQHSTIGVRPGPIEAYLPLSLTTYQTTAEMRGFRIERLEE